ncbi:type II secretion system protein GspM [Lysobacter sp. A03]|uniref:type II secretion system protein GspM n=1 Tax=Lysobacter sp. A03 TaxID=1199154 RepID=UPI0005B6B290|nr:type II secretion system protein GspM [Lysobacter sp. A03]KIQ96778.1 General secretion pathway protein M [Lysobacter sp. A03]
MRLHNPVAEAPTRRDRWLAAGLLLLVLALTYGVLVHPWWTVPMLEADARIESLQQRELRLRMQLRQAPQVAERLQQVRQEQEGMPGFLPEANPELATASLIQRLETVVAEASPGNRSCAITNRSPLDSDNRQSYPRVVAQVRLRCGTPELSRVLYLLESGSPRLFVDNLNILTQAAYLSTRGSAGRGGLDVSFDLQGYLLPLDAPPPAEVTDAR